MACFAACFLGPHQPVCTYNDWTGLGICCAFDTDGDGDVDLADWADWILKQQWIDEVIRDGCGG